jgi:hypothetical protein
VWTCPDCGAPFVAPNAQHSCRRADLDAHFARAEPHLREAFDRLVALATVDGPIPVVAQRTRIVLAAPMRFLAIQLRRHRLTGHLLLERPIAHRAVTEIVPDAYGTGLYVHRLSIRDASDLDQALAEMVAESARRVGRRQRLNRSGEGGGPMA